MGACACAAAPVLAATWTDWHSTTASSGLTALGEMEPMTVTDVTRAEVELIAIYIKYEIPQ